MFIRRSFIALIFAPIVFTVAVKRDAAQVLQDLQNMDLQSQSLTGSVDAFPSSGGTASQVQTIEGAAQQLDNAIKSATDNVNSSDPFDEADANNILSELQYNFAPDIQTGMNGLIAKESAIADLGMASKITNGLQALLSDTNLLSSAVLSKAPADLQDSIQNEVNTITSYLSSAINAYSA